MANLFVMVPPKEIEAIEQRAWENMFDVAPADYKKAYGMFYKHIDGATCFVFPKYPIVHFNMVIGLGFAKPVAENTLDEIDNLYRSANQPVYVLQYFDDQKSYDAASIFTSKGYRVAGGWERILWQAQSVTELPTARNITIKKVTEEDVYAWVKFIIDLYHYPVPVWLRNFWGKAGWEHFLALENDKIVAARSVFIGLNNMAWSGVEGPVPVVMTNDLEPDRIIWKHIQQYCLDNNVKYLAADIEFPSPERNTEAYNFFKQLGFVVTYLRKLYRK
jgi:hypothetical protein